jgi:ABC-type glycerol-3-phosphate transport system permease component
MPSRPRAPIGLKLAAAAALLYLHVPMFFILLYAFTTDDKSYQFPPPGLTLQWFAVAWERQDIWNALFLSVRVALVATAMAIVLGTLAAAALYRARSPIHDVGQLSCPCIFFQGLEDAVVPPAQAEMMVEALRKKGLPVAYLAFAGEQHGFRQAETIQTVLRAELAFYGRIFGFAPADGLPDLAIDNL